MTKNLHYVLAPAFTILLTLVTQVSTTIVPSPNWPSVVFPNNPSPITELTPKHFQEYGARRVQIKYGPFTIPANDVSGGMNEIIIEDAQKPCGNCIITTFAGDMVYSDGGYANLNTSTMLHHLLVFNTDVTDRVCPAHGAERFFATGNQRQAIDLGHGGQKTSGYWLSDVFMSLVGMAVNYDSKPRDVYFTIEWEFIPLNYTHFAHLQPYTLDGAGICGEQEVTPPKTGGAFNFTMTPAFSMDKDMIVVGAGGDVHDGALNLQVIQNGQIKCDLIPKYGTTPGTTDPKGMVHLSEVPQCTEIGPTKQGDNWTVTAHYDFSQHAPMMDGDAFAPVMGVSIMYALDPTTLGPQ